MTARPTRAALLALLLLAPAAAAAQGPAAAAVSPGAATGGARSLAYFVDWGPIRLAEVSLDLAAAADGGLTASARGASLGLAAAVADFEVAQTVAYAPDGAALYEAAARFSDRDSRRVVRFPAEGAPEVLEAREERREDARELTPIPPSELADVVDPAFPVVDALRRVAAGEGCGGTWRVFDGVRRMNITLVDEGPDTIEADRDWTYAGPALRCRLRFERVGGFPPRREDQPEEAEYDRLLWIAQLPDGPAPVRLRVSWPLGYATGRIVLR